jgi:DNA-binding beta-propeller fold protein YncE
MKIDRKTNIMKTLNPSRNLTARPRAGWLPVLLLLAGWLALVTPLRAENPPTYLFQIDSNSAPGGFLPFFVALDSSNNVYVADRGNDRVEKFDRDGNYLTQWGSFGTNNGQFEAPFGIAVDSSNNVYVADAGNYRIEKFTSSGTYLAQWGSLGGNNGQFDYAFGIAVDGSNNVYVADGVNCRIEKFTSSGTYLAQWGSFGTNNGQFEAPFGIAVDSSNNVYVADAGNYRIEKFTSSGMYLAQWGSLGTNNGQFDEPFGITVDSGNNVYVADIFNSRVEKFTSNGDYLTQWGSEGSGNGQFSDPADIAVDSSGNFVYVADSYNYRIEVFVNNANIVPPIITSQPISQVFSVGANVTLSVGVIGTPPFGYQWISNNVAVPGATNATFLLTNVNTSDSGSYSVLVTNSFGSELSGNAVLFLPAVAITQPASDISSTGAVLNGSVTLGSDETLAWFEWGTDNNYGNITGTTLVPGNNGSNSISTTLSGIPGDFYHYRMDAANDFGVVYGDDQSFTVGYAPTATTLAPSNSANGSTLNAIVNPEGWDTTVFFIWFANTTPGIDIGAGATSLNVSSFVPALSESIPYQYQVMASNALGTAYGQIVNWEPAQANKYLFSGSETNITLNAGTYIIAAYGAPGGYGYGGASGGMGAEMEAKFYFPTSTTLTLLVGGGGGSSTAFSGAGGGGSFVVEGSTPLVIAGGGGGGGEGTGGYPYGGGLGDNGTIGASGDDGGGDRGGFGGFAGRGGDGTEDYGGGAGGGGYGGPGGSGGSDNGGGASYLGGGRGGIGGIDNPGNGGYGGGGGGSGATESYGGYGGSVTFGGGGGGGYSGGGGGENNGGGGGGGSIIDSSAITILTEVSGIASPDNPTNGEIIITAIPTLLGIITTDAAFGFTNGVFGFDVAGPSGSNVVIQASTDLQTWIPLQTNLLGSGPLYFSDPHSTNNVQRFYRAQLSP